MQLARKTIQVMKWLEPGQVSLSTCMTGASALLIPAPKLAKRLDHFMAELAEKSQNSNILHVWLQHHYRNLQCVELQKHLSCWGDK